MSSRKYIPSLDGWRAIAIALVLFAHSLPSITNAEGNRINLFGLLGVKIFFGLSGFLITTLLLQEESLTGRMNLTSFYIRRFFRIMPAAVVTLAVIGALSFASVLDVAARRLLDTLLFFSNYSNAPHSYYVGHFWSLAVEEHFYFIWPAMLVAASSLRSRATIALAICVSISIWRAIAWKYHITTADNQLFWARTDINADAIMWGALTAILATHQRVRALLTSNGLRVGVPLILVVSILGWVVIVSDWKFGMLLSMTASISLPVVILQTSEVGGGTLEWQPVRWVGRISYSLYLWNPLFLTPDHIGLLRSFPVNLAAAVGCAIASYYLIERPFIRIGQSLDPASAGAFRLRLGEGLVGIKSTQQTAKRTTSEA